MRYFVTIGERTFEVELVNGTVTVDGQPVEAEIAPVPGTPVRHLRLDGRSYTLVARGGAERGAWDVHLDGGRFEVAVVDERTRTIQAMTGRASGPQGPKPVKAPMPGLVVRVAVEPGAVVRAGEGVVIIEAMKMENELRAEVGGTVARVLVAPGQAVEKGTVLVEFEA